MPSNQDSARRDAWSAYWAGGGLHSCVGSLDDDYSGAIGDFWRAVFAELPPGPLRALDLATGNGAIPRLLARHRPDAAIDAVDLASLAPAWHDPGRQPGIRFHSGVAMEALPFDADGFDLLTSQYGFEYARRDEALAEALRVLRPEGRLALVMHHAGSVLARVAAAESANAGILLAPGGLLEAADAVLPWLALARRGGDPGREPAALAAREAYNRAAQALDRAIAAANVPDLLVEARGWLQRLLASVGPDPAPSREALARYREALAGGALRSAELVENALDEAAADALVAAIRRARPGDRVECRPLSQAEGLLGWGLWLRPG